MRSLSDEERHVAERDVVQHHLVSALARIADHRLTFKGGTLLRACAFADYRYSEDLDFDWIGSHAEFRAVISEAVDLAARTSGRDLSLLRDKGPNPRVTWLPGQTYEDAIKTEAASLPEQQMPTRFWPILSNHSGLPPVAGITGYTLESVAADKLSCISRRVKPRDFYDLDRIVRDGDVDVAVVWRLYVAQYDNSARQYGKRNHPSDIRSCYLPKRQRLAYHWDRLIDERILFKRGVFVEDFNSIFDRVDRTVDSALRDWKQTLRPGELHRMKLEHKARLRTPRPSRAEPPGLGL